MYLSWVGSVPLSFKQRAVDKARNLIHHKYAKYASLKDASSLKSGFWLVMLPRGARRLFRKTVRPDHRKKKKYIYIYKKKNENRKNRHVSHRPRSSINAIRKELWSSAFRLG